MRNVSRDHCGTQNPFGPVVGWLNSLGFQVPHHMAAGMLKPDPLQQSLIIGIPQHANTQMPGQLKIELLYTNRQLIGCEIPACMPYRVTFPQKRVKDDAKLTRPSM